MKIAPKSLCLYAVTDRRWLKEETLAETVEQALQGGVTFVQLREKGTDLMSRAELWQEAKEIQTICRRYQVPFVIDDNVELALALAADGVHVGQKDMEAGEARRRIGENKILGVSARSVEEALLAQSRGADYLGVGAVFPTSSKDDARRVSSELLQAICAAVDIPVVAIGGITEANAVQLAGTGIAGCAAISAIFGQTDICRAANRLKQAVLHASLMERGVL